MSEILHIPPPRFCDLLMTALKPQFEKVTNTIGGECVVEPNRQSMVSIEKVNGFSVRSLFRLLSGR